MCVSALRWPLIVGLCLLLAAPASARELLAVGTNFPGVFEQQADGQPGGLAVSVLREVYEPLGHHVHFDLYPWARAQKMVEDGRADILIGPYKNAERETRFIFSAQPFYRDRIVFLHLLTRTVRWNGDYQQLLGRRIGVVRGWAYGTYFDNQREQLELVTVESVENGLRMLRAGRLELLASNQRNTLPLLAKLGLSQSVGQLLPQIDQQDGYFAFPRRIGVDPVRVDFDREFALMVDQGKLATLAAKWQVEVP